MNMDDMKSWNFKNRVILTSDKVDKESKVWRQTVKNQD